MISYQVTITTTGDTLITQDMKMSRNDNESIHKYNFNKI